MIDIILKLIEQNSIKASKLASDLGFSSGTISDWKSGRSRPNTDAIIKIAAYFNVTTDYLLTGIDPATADLTPEKALEAFGVKDKSNAKLIAQMIEFAKETK